MADALANNNHVKCCYPYYINKNCLRGSSCQYAHKARCEVDVLSSTSNAEYFVGRIRQNPRICRFFRRGNCIHQNNCHYRHDNDNSLRTNQSTQNRTGNRNSSTNNMPSTSTQFGVLTVTDLINASNEVRMPNPLLDAFRRDCEKERRQDLQKNPTKELRAETSAKDKLEDSNKQIEIVNNDQKTKEPQEEEGATASPPLSINTEKWVNAPEFVPKNSNPRPRSYAEALSPEMIAEKNANRKLCPYANKDGVCRNLVNCSHIHGDLCDMCTRFVLHPYNEEERKKHRQECLKQHEKNMEHSFAVARSKEKSCGVCFEIIMEKANGEQRFGILPNCNHCFCLSCIRKWRQARQFENKIIRACPECRVTSDFVCPSTYWVDTKEDKEKLIDEYKHALSRKDCKYFKKGEGKCPFGNKCFYLHAFPDGSKCDVGPPPRQRRPRNVDADIDVLQVMLWDFLDERDFPWQSLADDLEDLVSFFTDSDESDWSDYELFLD